MRLTVLNRTGEGEEELQLREGVLASLESIEWYLWHVNAFQALQHLDLDFLAMDYHDEVSFRRQLAAGLRPFSLLSHERPGESGMP